MGTFNVDLEIGDPAGVEFISINGLVDTGATHTTLPENLLHRLGVQPVSSRRFRLADGSFVYYATGYTWVRREGDTGVVQVVFAPDDASPLIGATTLENLGLAVDPVSRQLIPVDSLLM